MINLTTHQLTVPYLGCQQKSDLLCVLAVRQSSGLALHVYKIYAEVLRQRTRLIGVGLTAGTTRPLHAFCTR